MTLSLFLALACSQAPETPAAVEAPTPEAPAAEAMTHEEPAAAAPTVVDGWSIYGEGVPEAEVVAAAALFDAPDTFVDKTLVIEGRVADVCQKAGCWMVIEDRGRTMRITMKDHAFSVAKDGAGSDCQVHGTVIQKALDPETVAHLESESVNKDAMPEKNAEDGKVFEIVATGVRMRPSEG